MHSVLVVGGGLAGMAAAARLAKAGHAVQLWEATDHLGGHLAATPGPDDTPVDVAPAVIGFPAPWRDLFRKSGRTLEAELARSQCRLDPADPARYEFADGSDLIFPTDRGEQYTTLTQAYGQRIANRWRDLVDWLDDVWQAVRPLGLEAELTDATQLSATVRKLLRPRLTVADLAEQIAHPSLAALLRASSYRAGSEPERTPAWAAVSLSVERRFGRWTVVTDQPDDQARTGRTSALIDALVDRLKIRKVDVRLGTRVVAITPVRSNLRVRTTDGQEVTARVVLYTGDPWALPNLLPRLAVRRVRRDLRRLEPARAPRISHRLLDGRTDFVREVIRLTGDGVPVVRYRRPVGDATLESVHDFTTAVPTSSAGVAWRGFSSWFRRPRITTEVPGLFFAGPFTAAGGGLSQTVLAGALASYAAHDTPR
jgi:phytoene dehydrogenase-like protein